MTSYNMDLVKQVKSAMDMLVIFDMDGVLVDSNAAHFEAFQRIGREIGVPFTREMLERSFGMHNNRIFPLWLGSDLSAARVSELSARKEEFYRTIATTRLEPISGAIELVRSLHAEGISLAVGSSGPRANVELAVRTLGVRECFRCLITGDDVIEGKPSPEIFLKAADGGGADPKCCLVIEDAPQGVQAALAAGMKVVALTSSRPAEALNQAHLIVNSLSELSARVIRGLLA